MNRPRAQSAGARVFQLLGNLLRHENQQLALLLSLLGTDPSLHKFSFISWFALIKVVEATKEVEERFPILVRDSLRLLWNLDGLVPNTRDSASTRAQAAVPWIFLF